MHVVFDGMPAFNAHQSGEFVLAVRPLDVRHGKRHHHAVRVVRRLLVNRIDEIQGVLSEVALVSFRIDPDGKKFSSKIAAADFVEADVSDVVWIGGADIEILVEKPLRRVGVSIDDDGGVLNGAGFGGHSWSRRVRILYSHRQSQREEDQGQKEKTSHKFCRVSEQVNDCIGTNGKKKTSSIG